MTYDGCMVVVFSWGGLQMCLSLFLSYRFCHLFIDSIHMPGIILLNKDVPLISIFVGVVLLEKSLCICMVCLQGILQRGGGAPWDFPLNFFSFFP